MIDKRSYCKLPTYIIIVVFLGTLFVPSVSAAFRYLQEGMTAPSIEGMDLIRNEKVSSEKLSKENLVIITFWASWSQRSIKLLADLKKIALEFEDKPLRIIAINVDDQKVTPAGKMKIEKLVLEMDLPFPVIIDNNLDIFYSFGVIAVPSTAILDTKGVLRFTPPGYSLTTRDLISDSIRVLLGMEVGSNTELITGYTPDNVASRYYHLAIQLANQHMYERALSNLDMSIKKDSLFSAPHNLRGQILLALDSVESALDEFELAVTLDTNSVAAWAGWGTATRLLDSLDLALARLAEALKRDPYYTPALLDLSLCISESGDNEEALDSLTKAREANMRDPYIHYYIGRVYEQSGDISKAAESYRTALEIIFPDL